MVGEHVGRDVRADPIQRGAQLRRPQATGDGRSRAAFGQGLEAVRDEYVDLRRHPMASGGGRDLQP
jgi:hypothetical protein